MTLCEMCGKEDVSIIALVEGTELKVCKNCSKFGKILSKVRQPRTIQRKVRTEQSPMVSKELIETIVKDYGKLIKNAREKLNLKQEDFAKKINEKVSVIHNLESEHHEPNIELAKKLEKFLKIKLIEQERIEETKIDNKSSSQITIGDIIKLKK